MNDKVFVKESFKILNGIAAFKDDSVDEVENVEVYSKVNVDSWVEELQAEIERLKGENESLKIIDKNLREAEENFEKSYIRKLEENQQLKWEYEKLKCLALHGMIGYAACKMNLAVEKYKDHEMSSFAVPKEFSEWHRKKIEWTLAYRTTKMKLKEKIK